VTRCVHAIAWFRHFPSAERALDTAVDGRRGRRNAGGEWIRRADRQNDGDRTGDRSAGRRATGRPLRPDEQPRGRERWEPLGPSERRSIETTGDPMDITMEAWSPCGAAIRPLAEKRRVMPRKRASGETSSLMPFISLGTAYVLPRARMARSEDHNRSALTKSRVIFQPDSPITVSKKLFNRIKCLANSRHPNPVTQVTTSGTCTDAAAHSFNRQNQTSKALEKKQVATGQGETESHQCSRRSSNSSSILSMRSFVLRPICRIAIWWCCCSSTSRR
jgi:hypothetical protein